MVYTLQTGWTLCSLIFLLRTTQTPEHYREHIRRRLCGGEKKAEGSGDLGAPRQTRGTCASFQFPPPGWAPETPAPWEQGWPGPDGPPKELAVSSGGREGRPAKTETPRRRLGHPGAKADAAGDIAAGRPCGQRLSQLDVWGPWPQQLTCQQRAMGSIHICREALYEAPLDPKWILHSLESRWCHVSKSPRLEFAFQADGKSVWIQRADEMG